MKFDYQARDKEGRVQRGVIEASNEEAALAMLQNYGFYITSIQKGKSAPIYSRNISIFSSVSAKDVVLFCRQLSIMFKSDVPIVESLDAIAHQTKNVDFKEKISRLSQEVQGGAKLSAALSLYPKIFTPFFINMVRSGEASGKLSEALDYLASHLEYDYNFKSKIKGAMIYPALVVVVFIGILILLVYWILPPMMAILQGNGAVLPWSTKLIMDFSVFAKKSGWMVFLGLIILIIGIWRYSKTKEGKIIYDKYIIKLPLIGDLLKKIYISRLTENLSTLISGGLPIAGALEISGDVVGNAVYKDIIYKTRDGVRKGEAMSAILSNYPKEFPPLFIQMAVVGEKTGRIESAFKNIVDFYQKEVDRGIDTLLSLIEPVMIIFLGGGVAFLLISIFIPLYQVGNF